MQQAVEQRGGDGDVPESPIVVPRRLQFAEAAGRVIRVTLVPIWCGVEQCYVKQPRNRRTVSRRDVLSGCRLFVTAAVDSDAEIFKKDGLTLWALELARCRSPASARRSSGYRFENAWLGKSEEARSAKCAAFRQLGWGG